MPESSTSVAREFWARRARSVRRRVNFAWWVETVSPPVVGFSLVAAVALLLLRREWPALDMPMVAALAGAVVALIGGLCFLIARRRFEREDDALVRIEAAMRMRNALSAARAGVAPWPPPAGRIDAGLQWRWPRLVVPLLASLALLAGGLWIPVSAKSAATRAAAAQPQAWNQLDAELDLLTREEVVNEEYLEETRRQLDQLRSQEEDRWFSHSSLEATDALKRSHRAETSRVEKELERAANSLTTLEKNAGALNQAEQQKLAEEFQQALDGLRSGGMKPNPGLLEQMGGINPENLAGLTPEQLEQLQQNLAKHREAMGQCQGGGDGWEEELLAGDGDGQGGEGEGECDGEGDGPGSGGINRGPGHDPSVLGRARDPLETGTPEGIAAQDLSRSMPGDLLTLQDGEHEPDASSAVPVAGGDTRATGRGGERVTRESFDPDEQRSLKRFFE